MTWRSERMSSSRAPAARPRSGSARVRSLTIQSARLAVLGGFRKDLPSIQQAPPIPKPAGDFHITRRLQDLGTE